MATGLVMMYTDRVLPDVATKRAELETQIKPRIQAEIDADPFTQEQIDFYKQAMREKQEYLFAKRVLTDASLRSKYTPARRQELATIISSLEGNPQRKDALDRLEKIGHRIHKHEECRTYMTRGVGSMDDTRLAAYLAMKQAQSYRMHDPVEALPEEKMGQDFPHPRMYGILFDGLTLEQGKAFCVPGEGPIKTALKRGYTFRFDLLPEKARADIEADLVPRLPWDPSYMEAKGGR